MGEIYNKTILRPLAGLHFHPSNPRIHSEDSTKRLAASILEDPAYFEAHPILLSDRTGVLVIIGGEGRCRAARSLGMEKGPTFLFQGLTEEDEVRIMQKDNDHSGKWDSAKLKEIANRWGGEKVKKWLISESWRVEDDFQHLDEKGITDLFGKNAKTNYYYIVLRVQNEEERKRLKEKLERELPAEFEGIKIK